MDLITELKSSSEQDYFFVEELEETDKNLQFLKTDEKKIRNRKLSPDELSYFVKSK
jgi:hypothetical protein